MNTIRVSSKYQIVIPKAIRRKLDIKPGARLIVEGSDHQMVLSKEPTLKEIQMMLKGKIRRKDIDAFDETRGRDERDAGDPFHQSDP